jgi:hypothetical protein
MNRRILAAAATGGGMLAAAFLSTGVALADDHDTSGGLLGGLGGIFGGDNGGGGLGGLLGGGGDDNTSGATDVGSSHAFTAPDGLTFDPGSNGYDDVSPLFGVAPLLQIGGGSVLGADLADQNLTVFDTDGTPIGTAETGVNTSNVLGIESAQFTVTGTDTTTPDFDATQGDISSVLSGLDDGDFKGGDVDDVAKALAGSDSTSILGGNVSAGDVSDALKGADISIHDDDTSASDIAGLLNGADGTQAGGGLNIEDAALGDFHDGDFSGDNSSVSDVASALAGNEDTGILGGDVSADQVTSALGSADISFAEGGDVDAGDIASALNGYDVTENDISNAFDASGTDFSSDDFTGDDSSLSDVASALAGNDATDILGNSVTADQVTSALDSADIGFADGSNVDAGDIADALNADVAAAPATADLPADGTVYSITDFGFGFENFYEAVPGDGDAASSIQDTLITPFGNFDLSTMFDAIAPLMPGNAADGVDGTTGGGGGGDLFGGLGDLFGGGDDGGLGDIFGGGEDGSSGGDLLGGLL